jgi:hypothetical protein
MIVSDLRKHRGRLAWCDRFQVGQLVVFSADAVERRVADAQRDAIYTVESVEDVPSGAKATANHAQWVRLRGLAYRVTGAHLRKVPATVRLLSVPAKK